MNEKQMRPMLAATLKDIYTLHYPVYCTPKLDGIRCMVIDGKAYTRKLKPIPNKFIREILENLPLYNSDGEIIVGNTFQETSSAVMSYAGSPLFEYVIFDVIGKGNYCQRIKSIDWCLPNYVRILQPEKIDIADELLAYETKCLSEGYEGIIIRADVPYKHGRSTLKEQGMLKLKRFSDSEATITGGEPLYHNENELTTDELGYAKRSSSKENKVATEMLGYFSVVDLKTGVHFKVSTGMTQEQRKDYWKHKNSLLGKIIKYKYQPTGVKDKPRFPVFLGFREKSDL